MSVLVTGGHGMLACALKLKLPAAVCPGKDELDVTSHSSVAASFKKHQPRLVFNCAAYTRVDDAEKNPDLAMLVNGTGAENLAKACQKYQARLIHISTDYVFPGFSNRPWLEEDPVSPLSVYGRSKLLGEQKVQEHCTNFLIVRTSWLYGDGGPNFVDTMLRLGKERDSIRVVDDQIGCPTWTIDLANALIDLSQGYHLGICHWSNAGPVSWYGFASYILKQAGFQGKLFAIPSSELARLAPRPSYSVLDTSRASAWLGGAPRPWKQAVDEFLQNRQMHSIQQGS